MLCSFLFESKSEKISRISNTIKKIYADCLIKTVKQINMINSLFNLTYWSNTYKFQQLL